MNVLICFISHRYQSFVIRTLITECANNYEHPNLKEINQSLHKFENEFLDCIHKTELDRLCEDTRASATLQALFYHTKFDVSLSSRMYEMLVVKNDGHVCIDWYVTSDKDEKKNFMLNFVIANYFTDDDRYYVLHNYYLILEDSEFAINKILGVERSVQIYCLKL